MPTPISKAQLTILQNQVTSDNPSAAYDWLSKNGYNYASWANGVATGTTIAGASAVGYLQNSGVAGIGSQACRNMTPELVDKIRVEMAGAYLEALGKQFEDSSYVTRDIYAKEATAFHAQVFTDNKLGIENWTLSTPFKLIELQGGAAAVERYWQGMMATKGEGFDALHANATTFVYMFLESKSADPEVRSMAEQWLKTVTDLPNADQVMRDMGNSIKQQINDLKNKLNLSEAEQEQLQALASLDESIERVNHLTDTGQSVASTDIDDFYDALETAFQNPSIPTDPGITIAAAGEGTVTDGGIINGYGDDAPAAPAAPTVASTTPTSQSTTPITPISIAALNPAQNTIVNDTLGAAGLNQDPANPITALPPANGVVLLANSEGDIVGSVDISQPNLPNVQIIGQPAQMVDVFGNSYDPATVANLTTATTGLNLFNTLINGLQNWGDASDLGRVQTAVSVYNQVNSLTGLGIPNMGGLGAGLSLVSAIDNGDFGGIVVSGVQLGNAIGSAAGMGEMVVSQAIGDAIGMSAGNVIPGLSMIIALTNVEENPLGVVIAACAFFPPAGPLIGAVLSICQALFTSAPVSEGAAHASYDETGNLIITTDQDQHGGGSTANQWMTQLAQGAQLAGLQTPQAGAYTVGMPSVGYRYDPDGYNETDQDGKPINGYLTLNWTDANGVEHSRRYEGNGGGSDGFFAHNSIGEDFFTLMQTAQNRYPPLAYEQLDGGVLQLEYGVATVLYATNTQQYNGMAEHTQGGDEDLNAANDAVWLLVA